MSAEQMGVIISPGLLAVLLLLQPRMLLAASAARARRWLMFGSLPTGTPGPLPQGCSPAGPSLLVPLRGVTAISSDWRHFT